MTSLPLYLTHRGETNKVTKNKLYRCGKCISQIGNRWLHLKRNRILKGGKRREGGKKWRKKKNANVNTLCSLNEINVKWYVKKKKKWEYLWRFFSVSIRARRGGVEMQNLSRKRENARCGHVWNGRTLKSGLQIIPIRKLPLSLHQPRCLDSLNDTRRWRSSSRTLRRRGLLRGTDMHSNKKAYVSLRVYTAQMRLWRCGMHVSLNWLKSIGNRKRCAEYYTVARSGTAEMLACLPPHVMASHEHTYIWSPTAASSETDKGQSSLTFHFLFCRKKKKKAGRDAGCQGGVPVLSPIHRNCVSIFSNLTSLRLILQSNSRLLRSDSLNEPNRFGERKP